MTLNAAPQITKHLDTHNDHTWEARFPMNHNTEGQATLTRLPPAAHAADASSTVQPRHREQHRQVNWLRDVILGGRPADALVRRSCSHRLRPCCPRYGR